MDVKEVKEVEAMLYSALDNLQSLGAKLCQVTGEGSIVWEKVIAAGRAVEEVLRSTNKLLS